MSTDRIVQITLSGLAGCMLLSWSMWGIGERGFPVLPLWGEASVETTMLHAMLFGGVVTLLIGGIMRPAQAFLLPLILLLLCMCALDLNRLQPWLWFYVLVLAVIFLHKNTAFTALRWLLAAVYFWGGLNKLTPYFAEDNFAWFCEAFEGTRFLGEYPILGYGVALVEAAMGILLLWPKRKSWWRWIFVGFHGIIILFLLQAKWNFVVLPWNIAISAIAFVLLSQATVQQERLQRNQMAILALAWIFPLAAWWQYWPFQLSWQLYSNTQPEAVFYSPVPCAQAGGIWAEKSFDEGRRLLLDDWAIATIGVPMFYADHTFQQMGRYLCDCTSEPDSSRLIILRVRPWNREAEQTTTFSCGELKPK
jgi:hypothetical protein